MDHPSFFHSSCSTRAGAGFPPDNEPSSLSGSAGTVSALLGELVLFLNDGTPQNNKPVPSSIDDIRRNSHRTSGNSPPPKTKKASNPCKQSEAMIKISKLVELPIVCGALLKGPKLPLRAFSFLSLQKADTIIVKQMKRKISPPFLRKARVGQIPEYFIGGSILLSKGGSL